MSSIISEENGEDCERHRERDEFRWCGKRILQDENPRIQTQLDQLKDEKLYMEVYQRREHLRFFGIQEVGAEEDTRKVLVDFLRTELGLEDADGL